MACWGERGEGGGERGEGGAERCDDTNDYLVIIRIPSQQADAVTMPTDNAH